MTANPEFKQRPKSFWAYVRVLSQCLGYTVRGKGLIKVPTYAEIWKALDKLGLDTKKCVSSSGKPTELGEDLHGYFFYRSQVLYNRARPSLMNADEAREVFETLKSRAIYPCPLPMNKQKGDKARPAYFTGIVNMLVADTLKGAECNYDPRALTTVTREGKVVRTFSRWLDGAFPTVVNPIAVWEIKEYYYTTTFGSRIADGVYETLLDGMEIEELREHEGIDIKHYLMVDAYGTWWQMGKGYLCRMVDMLHMGYVDEVLFGREVVERIPSLVEEWIELQRISGFRSHTL